MRVQSLKPVIRVGPSKVASGHFGRGGGLWGFAQCCLALKTRIRSVAPFGLGKASHQVTGEKIIALRP